MVKVTELYDNSLTFDDGSKLYDDHSQDCCEHHYLHWDSVSLTDFEGLEFDLSSDTFFERVEDYGIRLLPVNGQPINIPGYGYNNGYYSSNLTLILDKNGSSTKFDISECQEWKDY